MSIQYSLRKNEFSPEADGYIATIHTTGTADLERIIERMIESGTTINRPDILGTLDSYYTAIESLILEGYNVITPGATFNTSIKGTFSGPGDAFDPQRHQLRCISRTGARLREAVARRARPTKVEPLETGPRLFQFTDVNSSTRDQTLTPGGIGKLRGRNLKFDPDDEAQGIYLLAADHRETRVAFIGENKSGNLTFLIPPELPPGEYQLQVRARPRFNTKVRRATLDKPLIVPPAA